MISNDHMTSSRFPQASTRTFGLAMLLLAGAVGASACAAKRESTTSPCPCATSNVCCTSGVCAKDEASCDKATLALATEAAGTWTGYFENFTLFSGSDALKISLAVEGEIAAGQVVLGEVPPPTLPTDTSTPWPPGVGDAGTGSDAVYVEGFVYHARDIRWESRRLKFNVDLAEGWQPFCDLYKPITVGSRSFICPEGGWSYATNDGCRLSDGTSVDCTQLFAVCQGAGYGHCVCNETSCTAFAETMSIDVSLHGDDGDGSVTGILNANNIRLIRSSN